METVIYHPFTHRQMRLNPNLASRMAEWASFGQPSSASGLGSPYNEFCIRVSSVKMNPMDRRIARLRDHLQPVHTEGSSFIDFPPCAALSKCDSGTLDPKKIRFTKEVEIALQKGDAIVALESTIISHGTLNFIRLTSQVE